MQMQHLRVRLPCQNMLEQNACKMRVLSEF
jgi:hypothetical protein